VSSFKLDFDRADRIGLEEAVFCQGKTTQHIVDILVHAEQRKSSLLLSRLDEEKYDMFPSELKARLDFDVLSGTAFFESLNPLKRNQPRVAVVCAGTSDERVSREAVRTLQYFGEPSTEISDVGVAGIWRLLERVDEIAAMPVVIAIAGMDAALPTVLGGLIPSLIVGVPTSVGYGVANKGQTALNSILTGCAPGIVVVNIDNGYGAACAAIRALNMLDRAAQSS